MNTQQIRCFTSSKCYSHLNVSIQYFYASLSFEGNSTRVMRADPSMDVHDDEEVRHTFFCMFLTLVFIVINMKKRAEEHVIKL